MSKFLFLVITTLCFFTTTQRFFALNDTSVIRKWILQTHQDTAKPTMVMFVNPSSCVSCGSVKINLAFDNINPTEYNHLLVFQVDSYRESKQLSTYFPNKKSVIIVDTLETTIESKGNEEDAFYLVSSNGKVEKKIKIVDFLKQKEGNKRENGVKVGNFLKSTLSAKVQEPKDESFSMLEPSEILYDNQKKLFYGLQGDIFFIISKNGQIESTRSFLKTFYQKIWSDTTPLGVDRRERLYGELANMFVGCSAIIKKAKYDTISFMGDGFYGLDSSSASLINGSPRILRAGFLYNFHEDSHVSFQKIESGRYMPSGTATSLPKTGFILTQCFWDSELRNSLMQYREDSLKIGGLIKQGEKMAITPIFSAKEMDGMAKKNVNEFYATLDYPIPSDGTKDKVVLLNHGNNLFFFAEFEKNGSYKITKIEPKETLKYALEKPDSVSIFGLVSNKKTFFILLGLDPKEKGKRLADKYILQKYSTDGKFIAENEVLFDEKEGDKIKKVMLTGLDTDIPILIVKRQKSRWTIEEIKE